MRQDECDYIADKNPVIHPKRMKYLLEKWEKRGEKEFARIKELIINKKDYIKKLDGKIARIFTINWMPPIIGVIRDCSDNGYYFDTRNVLRGHYWLGDGWNIEKCIAYVEPYPDKNIWRKLNYIYWKHNQGEDYFHQKISIGSWNTHLEFADGDGFEWHNPSGNLGECFDYCQCKEFK